MEEISQPDYLNEDTIRKEQVTIDKEKICKHKKENIYKNIDKKTKFCACCGEKMFEICDEENRKLLKSNFSDNDIGWICLECGNIEEISRQLKAIQPLKLRGFLALIFRAILDMSWRIYCLIKYRTNLKALESYQWRKIQSTKEW